MLETQYGLDQPIWKQYWDYCRHLVRGDLGPSFKHANWSVNELIGGAFPVSLELGCYAIVVAMILGIAAGLIAALRPNSALDYVPMSLATLGICLPTFVLGPLLILVFAIFLGLFNSSGWFMWEDRVLPALTLGGYYAAYTSRLARGGMLEILSQDFIRTARAKGVPETRLLLKHAVRGGLMPVLTFSGPAIAGLVTGSFAVETIFNIPGLGRFFITAAFDRDYTMVMGAVLFYAVLVIGLNLAVDILQVWLNPKLKFARYWIGWMPITRR